MRLRRPLAAFLIGTTMFTHFPEKAQADPITLSVAAVATASSVGSIAGIATYSISAFGFTLLGAPAVFASFAVRAALGFAMNALMSKGRGVAGGYTINELGPALPHTVVYGETRVGGVIFYQTLTDKGGEVNEYYHMVIAVAGHEIDSFQAIYFDDDELTIDASGNVTAPSRWNGVARIKLHTGGDGQGADADLVSEVSEWTAAHRARGVAYIYIRFDYDATAFANGVPNVTAKIRGKKIYDPRDGTTSWSSNSALVLRDYLTAGYGLAQTADEIDDDLVIAAANVCDETTDGGSRFTCNGAILLDSRPEDILRNLLSSMGGTFWYANGKWGMQAAEYITPVYTFTEDDLRGNLKISTRQSRRDNFNGVTGVYRGADTDYAEADYEPIVGATYVTEDNGAEAFTDLPLIFTDTEVMARRIATIFLERNRRQITVSGQFGLRALLVRVGDTIKLTNAYAGWTEKVFEVVDWKMIFTNEMDINIAMILREIDSFVFAPSALAAYAIGESLPKLVADFDAATEYYSASEITSTFDDLFTHTGESLRTMVDSDGSLKWAAHNLLLQSEDLSSGSWTGTNVTVTSNATTSPDGDTSADLVVPSVVDVSHKVAPSISGSFLPKATLAFWVKENAAAGYYVFVRLYVGSNNWEDVFVQLSDGAVSYESGSSSTATSVTGTSTEASDGWYIVRVEYDYDSLTEIDINFSNNGSRSETTTGHDTFAGDGTSGAYFWGVHYFQSSLGGMADNPSRPGTYVETTSTAAYKPRRQAYTYDGSNYVKSGLLLESEARTNLLTYSEDFTDATWSKQNAGTLAVDATGPDGQTSAVTLVDSGATGTGFAGVSNNTFTVSTTTAYTFSAFLKADQLSWAALRAINFTTPATGSVYFDLSTGSVGTEDAGLTGRVEDFGGGWYRCSITFTTDAADTSGAVGIYLADADGDITVDLDGTSSILIFGAQFEDGSTPSSYIPTSGATVARAAESRTTDAVDAPYSASGMSGSHKAVITYADEGAASQETIFDWRSDANNRITITLDTDGAKTGTVTLTVVNAASSVSVSATAELTPGINKSLNVAWRLSASEMNIALSGTAETAVASPGVPDLSAADVDWSSTMSTSEEDILWDADLGDTGIVTAST